MSRRALTDLASWIRNRRQWSTQGVEIRSTLEVFRNPGATLVATYFLVAIGFPGLSVSIPVPGAGSAPLYVVDSLAVGMVAYAVWSGRLRPVLDRWLLGAFGVFLIGALLGLAQGLALSGFSVFYIYTTGRLALTVAAMIALILLIDNDTMLRVAVGGICGGLLIITLIGIGSVLPEIGLLVKQFLTAYYPGDSYAQIRVRYHDYAFATWYTATSYAAVLSMTAVFPLVFWLRRRDRTYLVLLLVALVSFVLAETRHPILALGPALLFVTWQTMSRRQQAGMLGGGLLVLVALQLIGLGRTPLSFLADLSLFLAPLAEQEGVVIRLRSIQNFFEFARTYPVRTLVGFGPDYVSIVDRGAGDAVLRAARDAKAINSVLTLVLYYGLVGMLGYFAVAGVAIWRGIERLWHVDFRTVSNLSLADTTVYAGTVAVAVGVLLHPFDQYFVVGGIKMRYVFWGLLAVQQAALSLGRASEQTHSGPAE